MSTSLGALSELVQQRYRGVSPEALLRARGLEPLLSHRSVRRYSKAAAPPGTLEALIAGAQNAVVAAEASGLGTAFIGALRNRPDEVAEILELPERVFALFGLCVGYADLAAPTAVKPRLPQSVVLGTDRYRPVARDAVQDYDRTMTDFYAEQGMPVPAGGWSLHSAQRVRNRAALNGRDRLVEVLNARGFELR